MSVEHRDLAGGRWWTLSLYEQLGNIGSEISRATRWSSRNPELARRALHRAESLRRYFDAYTLAARSIPKSREE